VTLASACGDDDGGPAEPDAAPVPDATPGVDAAQPDAPGLNTSACPATYGPGAITATLAVSDTTADAFDLDNNKSLDNRLAIVASLLNGDFTMDLQSGALRLMTELREVADLTLVDEAAAKLVLFIGADTDMPVNAADDFSHMEPFYYRHASVDPATCEPNAVLDIAIAGGVLSGSAAVVTLPIGSLGLVDLGLPHVEMTVAPDTMGVGFQATGGRLGGAIPPCPLQGSMGGLGQNNLHAVVQFLSLQPDIDLDGDGLETIQTDTNGILGCTDGDGTTAIAGATCGCDPRMADGFSILLRFTNVGASVMGPSPTP
jgi:hypothetical protein